MSNFVKNRGFLDPNRLLHAPHFNRVPVPVANPDGGPNSNFSATPMMMGAGPEMSNTQVLWGTNINTNDIQVKLRDFLLTFRPEDADGEMNLDAENEDPFYISQLRSCAETEEYTLDIDCTHLFTYNKALYKQLEDYPTDIIPIFDLVASQVLREYVMDGNNQMGD
jgi:hypothetical protein